ncbi:MAG: 2-hydroxyacyl-CoA dehydratase family protein [Bacillota bacterium]
MQTLKAKEIIGEFQQIVSDPAAAIKSVVAEKIVRVIGHLPTDVPEELIHAAGAHPFGVVVYDGTQVNRADEHLQTWACSLIRCAFGMALAGRLNYLQGLLVPTICDTTRTVYTIWKKVKPFNFMENFLLPRQLDRPSAKSYLLGEMGRLKARLEQFTDRKITAQDLYASIRLYNRNRALLRRLYELHVRYPEILGNRATYDVIKTSLLIPKEKHNELLNRLFHAVEQEAGKLKRKKAKAGVRVILSGKLWEPPSLLDILDETGAVCVGDDLCTGYRYIANDVAENGDPYVALAERQLAQTPVACFTNQKQDRKDVLLRKVRETRADGVIFVHLKFCEPENYDYPYLAETLNAAGIPALRIETEVGNVSLGQIRTRLGAFVEMLEGAK